MNLLDLVDPELRGPLERFPALGFSPDQLARTRAVMGAARARWAEQSQDQSVRVDEHFIPSCGGKLRLLVYRMKARPQRARPCLLNIHGGAFVMGAPEMDDGENRRWARELDAVIVSPDYRLAPEHPFPAAHDDCHAALRWIVAQSNSLGVDPRRIAIAGKSAGGGIAAGLALRLRDEGDVKLVHQHLVYPMIDDRPVVDPEPGLGAFVIGPEDVRLCWRAYLGSRDQVSPYAAPARAKNLEGLPPTFISVGDLDLFRDADIAYARELEAAGVVTDLRVYRGAYHGFDLARDASLAKAHARHRLAALSAAFDIGA